MKGIEAKYTAKTISEMIKRNRGIDKKFHRKIDNETFRYADEISLGIANFAGKEARILSSKFRAFMIHNAFMKNRPFTSAEVAYFNLGENAVNSIKTTNLGAYSRYVERKIRQQKAINIVRYQLLDEGARDDFDKWLQASSNDETWFETNFVEA